MKKDGKTLRKILMTVPFNTGARSVEDLSGDPGYGLLGCAACSQMRTYDDEMHAGALDQRNVFTYCVVPESWRRYQAGPRVRVRDLPPKWVSQAEAIYGTKWPTSKWLRPYYNHYAS